MEGNRLLVGAFGPVSVIDCFVIDETGSENIHRRIDRMDGQPKLELGRL